MKKNTGYKLLHIPSGLYVWNRRNRKGGSTYILDSIGNTFYTTNSILNHLKNDSVCVVYEQVSISPLITRGIEYEASFNEFEFIEVKQ